MEYLENFGLSKDPFEVEPDLDFYAENTPRRLLRMRVQRGLTQAKGLTVLSGAEGTGKTLLARRILHDLDAERFESIWMVVLPGARGAASLLQRFARELGVAEPATERGALLKEIHAALQAIRSEGRHGVLILDDAHYFDKGSWAAVSSLLAMESDERRLLSLLLVGSPAILERLCLDGAVDHRVDVRAELAALQSEDVASYLEHRWESAGGTAGEVLAGFAPRIFALSAGRLRRINTLMDNALFEAVLAGRCHLESEDIESAARALGYEGAPSLTGPGFDGFSTAPSAPSVSTAPAAGSMSLRAAGGAVGASVDSSLWLDGGSDDLSLEDNGVEMLLGEEDVLELGDPIPGLASGGFEE